MGTENTVRRQTYAGLFLVTLATLMYEILLTRIFSVTMWYHFAFVAISVAMFGMTVGAIVVYLFPRYFAQEQTKYHLALGALLFAYTIVFSFLTQLSIPFVPQMSITGLYSLALTYTVITVPFVFSGICVSLALTRFPDHVGKLYAVDLAGAAVGCLLLIYMLDITDGPTGVIAVAFVACIGAMFFAADAGAKRVRRIALTSAILFGIFVGAHSVMVMQQSSLLRLMWVKGSLEAKPLYEKWNSFSRIKVEGDPAKPEEPFGWGLSSTYPLQKNVMQLFMNIDATAATVLTSFHDNFDEVAHLKYDVTNVAHYVRRDAKVLVVGVGGGRDILSALTFGQKSVVGVEINDDIIKTVNRRFGDFTGHLDNNPKVTFVNDEARSYITRSKDRFDIIQVSLIDTWAATAAGAFVLTENSLYTVEAWKIFLEHLDPNGVLTFSRWYFRDRRGEVYRLTSLASASLIQLGIGNPRNNIIVVRNLIGKGVSDAPGGVGTILVSKQPFSDRDLAAIEDVAREMQFEIVLSPKLALDTTFATLASGTNLDAFTAAYPINIAAPTDDSPFFFHMLRLRDVFNLDLRRQGSESVNMKAVFILGSLLIVVAVLTFLCIIVPLFLTSKRTTAKEVLPLFMFFGSIGFGFMLIEISQMQRLTVFLGHPIYALSVVLFVLLLSSGLGSYLTHKISDARLTGSALVRLSLLLCTLIIFGILTPHAVNAFQASTTPVRILVAAGILSPLGVFMGMAFPLGMKVASGKLGSLTPWLWGINGATSVTGSVIAIAIALSSSISTAFWTGFACYLLACVAFVWASRGK